MGLGSQAATSTADVLYGSVTSCIVMCLGLLLCMSRSYAMNVVLGCWGRREYKPPGPYKAPVVEQTSPPICLDALLLLCSILKSSIRPRAHYERHVRDALRCRSSAPKGANRRSGPIGHEWQVRVF